MLRRCYIIWGLWLCTLWFTPLRAQIRWGVRGGFNLTEIQTYHDMLQAHNKQGFFLGPSVMLKIPFLGLSADASLLYERNQYIISGTYTDPLTSHTTLPTTDATTYQHRILVPLNLRVSMGLGDFAKVFIFGGPQYAFTLNTSNKHLRFDTLDEVIDFKSTPAALSYNLGVGALLFRYVQLSAQYSLPHDEDFKLSFQKIEKEIQADKHNFQVSLTIWL